jgi:hypothetical protein
VISRGPYDSGMAVCLRCTAPAAHVVRMAPPPSTVVNPGALSHRCCVGPFPACTMEPLC